MCLGPQPGVQGSRCARMTDGAPGTLRAAVFEKLGPDFSSCCEAPGKTPCHTPGTPWARTRPAEARAPPLPRRETGIHTPPRLPPPEEPAGSWTSERTGHGAPLTSLLQPPVQGPDHLGAAESLEAGPHVLVVPLQRAHLHHSAETRAQARGTSPGRPRACAQTRARPPAPAHLARWQGSQSQPRSSGWARLQLLQAKRPQCRHCLLLLTRSR